MLGGIFIKVVMVIMLVRVFLILAICCYRIVFKNNNRLLMLVYEKLDFIRI